MRLPADPETRARLARLEIPWNACGTDPYGVSREHVGLFMSILRRFYRDYFHVEVRGGEHVPRGRAMLVGNHSGGIALDAAMTIAACFYELEPPRLAQSMVEKFLQTVPFFGTWTSRFGQFTGLPEHAQRLLEEERLLLVFPEGSRGTAKLYSERHSLVDFGSGFVRLALQTRTPIVPFAFLGGGEAIPTFVNLYSVGRALGAPYVPLTPWVLPLPLPAKLSLELGEPIVLDGNGDEGDDVIFELVAQVRRRVAELIERGLERRGGAP